MKSGCLVVFLALYLLIYLGTDHPNYNVEPIEDNYPNPKADPNREVIGFDWHKMDYKYRDQIPKDTGIYVEPGVMPDYYVAPVPSPQTRTRKRRKDPYYDPEVQVQQGNKRYRVNVKPDGTLELIPIR